MCVPLAGVVAGVSSRAHVGRAGVVFGVAILRGEAALS
jgi:hypothetical protein